MNYMKQVAEMLGVELGEEFTTNIDDSKKYKITSEGLFCLDSFEDWFEAEYSLMMLLIGKLEIKWQPQVGDFYYFVSPTSKDCVGEQIWQEDKLDVLIKQRVGIHRTREQAINQAKELGWLE